MRHNASRSIGTITLAVILLSGCGARKGKYLFHSPENLAHYKHAATQIDEPCLPIHCDPWHATAPRTILTDEPPEYWDLALDEAVHTALANSDVLRDLGAQLLRAPDTVNTIHDPAIRETDPRFGVEAVLSAFDAEFATSAFFEKNDRAVNNRFARGTEELTQDLAVFQTRITKRTAVGTEFTIRHDTDYDANNGQANIFPSAWNTLVDAEFRHPLLRGSGVRFNRIGGPLSVPGVANGVLIARIDTDISLADFELSLVDLVSDVENAYWDLYYAYRDLDAKIAARDRALTTWKSIDAWARAGRIGGEADQEAQAREQYFRFEEEVHNALTGRLLEGTQNDNGSSGGTFRATPGVHVAERRLRLLMGVPINDRKWIRPQNEPNMSLVKFDWQQVLPEALARRSELRRQRWQIKRRELELIASRNFLLPQLDTVGRYRFRGFGDDLLDPDRGGTSRFDNAYKNLTSGDFQEWQLGFEFSMPIGHRRGHAAVRNAQLALARERSVLGEQERQVAHDLTTAVADKDRAFVVARTNYNRRLAAIRQLAALQHRYESESRVDLDLLLDAQRRLSDAESRYYQSLVEYTLAVKNVHYEKGSLLDYNEIYMAEGPWPGKAYADAARRDRYRLRPGPLNYILPKPLRVSLGMAPQQIVTGFEEHVEVETAPEEPRDAAGQLPPGPAATPLYDRPARSRAPGTSLAHGAQDDSQSPTAASGGDSASPIFAEAAADVHDEPVKAESVRPSLSIIKDEPSAGVQRTSFHADSPRTRPPHRALRRIPAVQQAGGASK